jgi:TonB-dependent receptor
VEINKTLSASQDGDAVAGSVNLVTKRQGEKPTLYLNGIGGYTPIIGGRSLYEIDGTVGKRFGASKKLGIIFGASYDWNGRGIDDVEPSPTAIQCDPGPTGCANPSSSAPFFSSYSSQDWREYRYYRTRYGFTGAVDYKLGDVSGLYVRFLYSHFDNFGDRWVYSPQTNSTSDSQGNQLTSGWLTPNLTDPNASIGFNSQIRRPVEVIGSLVAGGKHAYTRWVFAYDFSVARSASEDHGYSSSKFQNPNTYQFGIDTTNPFAPKFVPVPGASSIYDTTQYFLNSGDTSRTYSPQLNLQTGFSAQRNYDWGGHFGTLDFGFKFRNAHKFEDAADNYFMLNPATDSSGNSLINPNDPALAMNNFLDTFTNSNYYDKKYTFGRTTNYRKIQSFLNSNLSSVPGTGAFFVPDVNSTAQNTFPNNYDLVERITAGYVMNTIDIGRVRVQAGVRFEATSENVLGNIVYFDSNGALCTAASMDPTCPQPFTGAIAPVRKNSDYLDALPSMQLRVRLFHDAALRASYGRGISRPNFGDLPPFFNAQGNKANEIDIGNPNLKPSRANNYDLLYEQNLKPLGLLQGGFFFKQLTHPIYESAKIALTSDVAKQYNIPAFYVVNPPFDLSRPVNGQSAVVWGLEIAYQQHLSFLPGALSGIGIAANYGYTHSKTNVGTFIAGGTPPALLRTDEPALLRQAPNTWNISPTYDRWRISARLGISHNDANIFSYNYQNLNSDGTPATVGLGLKGPNGDTYLYAHTQVDAQASFRMYRGLQLIVAGLNLTNEVFGFYNGSTQYPIQREYYKPSYMFGLRYTLANESK